VRLFGHLQREIWDALRCKTRFSILIIFQAQGCHRVAFVQATQRLPQGGIAWLARKAGDNREVDRNERFAQAKGFLKASQRSLYRFVSL
jgi:hypothetical protein